MAFIATVTCVLTLMNSLALMCFVRFYPGRGRGIVPGLLRELRQKAEGHVWCHMESLYREEEAKQVPVSLSARPQLQTCFSSASED